MWVSFVVGGLTALFTIIGGHLLGGFVTGGIFVAIGIGIQKCPRVATRFDVRGIATWKYKDWRRN